MNPNRNIPSFYIILLIFSFLSIKVTAQVNGYDLKYVVSFHGLDQDTDYPNDRTRFSYLARALVRYELTNELEVGFFLLLNNIRRK